MTNHSPEHRPSHPILARIFFGHRSPQSSIEVMRRTVLLYSLCAIAMLVTAIMGLTHLIHHATIDAATDLTSSLVFLIIAVFIRATWKLSIATYLALVFFGLFLIYNINYEGIQAGIYFWAYIYPPVIVYLLGNRKGTVIAAAFIGIMLVIFFFPGTPFLFTPYSSSFRFRFLFSYFVVTVIAMLFESLRTNAENRILQKTGELERTIVELRETERALRVSEQEQKVLTDQLSRSNRELQDFAHTASHDLQEPLRKITSFGDRLVSKYTDALGEQGRDYLGRMQSAAIRMQSLIEGLLAYSRIESKALPFETVDLNAVLKDVLSDLEVRIAESQGRIDSRGLPSIEADPVQMRQLLQNLIGNALKYRKPDVSPVVTIEGSLEGLNTTIAVADNGIGFDPKDAERIFGIFQRLHGRSSAYEGSGIGLSVCRKIVERHGGTIVATGTTNEGACFTVSLPLSQNKSAKK
jgi:signal transduction histidine kinase